MQELKGYHKIGNDNPIKITLFYCFQLWICDSDRKTCTIKIVFIFIMRFDKTIDFKKFTELERKKFSVSQNVNEIYYITT